MSAIRKKNSVTTAHFIIHNFDNVEKWNMQMAKHVGFSQLGYEGTAGRSSSESKKMVAAKRVGQWMH